MTTQHERDVTIDTFNAARHIVSKHRRWHFCLQVRFQLSPAVKAAMLMCRPHDWQQLLLEWPHAAEMDKSRIAYTRNERAGEDDKQTVTSMGKYLKQHFPDLSDHAIRDLVAAHGTVSRFAIHDQLLDMIHVVQNGPVSCMQWSDKDCDELGHHPYEVYDPALGWKMAARYDGMSINGRALVMDRPDDGRKYFVRTYRRNDGGYSGSDEELAQWLKAQGFEHRGSWKGERLACITRTVRRGTEQVIAPYIDGGAQAVDIEHVDNPSEGNYKRYLRIKASGDYACNNTDGIAEERSRCTCEDCGERVNDDDVRYVGYDSDMAVCEDCQSNHYTYVTGRRGNCYHVHDDDAVEVDGEYYHDEYLGDNGIVQLDDGDYVREDDATWVESRSAYYRSDEVVSVGDDYELEDDCVELANGDWCLRDDAWQCAESEEWYSNDDDDDKVVVDGETYHRDNAPEPAQDELPLEPTNATE